MSNAALMERGFLTQDRLIWSTWVDLAHLIRCFLEFIHFGPPVRVAIQFNRQDELRIS